MKRGMLLLILVMPFFLFSMNTQSIMHKMLSSLEVLLPLSLSSQGLGSKPQEKEVSRAVDQLAAAAAQVSTHFSSVKTDYHFLAGHLRRDATAAQKLLKAKKYDQAAFIIRNIVANCFSCHSKIPSVGKRDPNQQFMAKLKSLGVSQRSMAEYMTMTRDFSGALKQYEQLFLTEPESIDTGAFSSYLKLSIRVEQNISRVESLFESILQSATLRPSQAKQMQKWLNSTKAFSKRVKFDKPSLKAIREIVREAKPSNVDDAVVSNLYLAVASAMSNNLLRDSRLNRATRSELYYLQGVSEKAISDSFWVSEYENYFEQSIRLQPKSSWSKRAFKILKESYVIGYSGSGGTHLPAEVKSLLEELEGLMK